MPTLEYEDPCFHNYVPRNATQISDIPSLRFDLIGIAPWVSKHCSRDFLNAAASDTGKTMAVIFYTLNQGNYTSGLPPRSDPMWGIDFTKYHFPVYAINADPGEALMDKVALYSGNMTDVWDSPQLALKYDPRDFARVYLKVDTGSRNPLPGLWIFLLIVIAVVIFIFGFTSMVMHWIQYRYRLALRRRVASGEIDLETMGIKRLTIPQDILDKFPLRVYENIQTPSQSPRFPVSSAHNGAVAAKSLRESLSYAKGRTSPPNGPRPWRHGTQTNAFSQSNCAVCLEEYEPGVTNVRELPCLHIFHPECIDPHLSNNSSLCPLCKASALPKGYVPPHLTNATVRRERNMRRMRERYANNSDSSRPPNSVPSSGLQGAFSRFTGWRGNASDAEDYENVRMGGASNGGRHGEPRRRSFSAIAAPTQEEEEEEWRNMSRCKL